MTIESAISAIGLLRVSSGHDDKAKQDSQRKDGKRRVVQDELLTPHPVLNEQGQTMGMLIDIAV